MKTKNRALERIGVTVAESYYQREIRAKMSMGGMVEIIIRGDSVTETLRQAKAAFLAAAFLQPLEEFVSVDVELEYWHLTEELESFSFSESLVVMPDNREQISGCVHEAITLVAERFIQRAALNRILLVGQDGKLDPRIKEAA